MAQSGHWTLSLPLSRRKAGTDFLLSYLFSLWRIFIQTSEQPYAIPIQKFDSMFFERDPYCIKISLLHERPAVNPFGPRNRRM